MGCVLFWRLCRSERGVHPCCDFPMRELLQIGLLIGGWSLVTLCLASFWIPKVLGWREKLAGLTPLMREVWWTYSAYVWGSHVFFAVLALGFGDWLMGGSRAAA